MARRKSFSEYRRENAAQKAWAKRLVGYIFASRRIRGLPAGPPTKEETQAAGSADTIVRDPLISHLSQEQREHIASVIVTVEMTGTPENPDEHVLQNNRCYMNAAAIVAADKSGRIAYVEGVTEDSYKCGIDECSDRHTRMTHHAWNEIDNRRFDVTAVINQHVRKVDHSQTEYRGDVVTRGQLADRDSGREPGWKRWRTWRKEHADTIKEHLDAFFAVHGEAVKDLELSEYELDAMMDTLWASVKGYPTELDDATHVCYFTHAELHEKFGYEDEFGWVVDWTKERLAETTERMTPGGAHQGTTPSECAA